MYDLFRTLQALAGIGCRTRPGSFCQDSNEAVCHCLIASLISNRPQSSWSRWSTVAGLDSRAPSSFLSLALIGFRQFSGLKCHAQQPVSDALSEVFTDKFVADYPSECRQGWSKSLRPSIRAVPRHWDFFEIAVSLTRSLHVSEYRSIRSTLMAIYYLTPLPLLALQK